MTRLAALFARLGPDPRADAALLRAFLADRDEAAFGELVRRHGPTVWGVCRRQLPNPADAEDAFQATFLVLLRRRPAGETLAPWLYRVAVLTCRGLRRKNARRRTVPLPAGLTPAARPDPLSLDVDALLMRLPERERAAVVLCHLHGLTQREAADRLGVPEGTLSARVSRGLARLQRAAGFTPAVLAPLAVPAAVAEAAVTVATAGRAMGPGVGPLVTEVLRMFWLKKLATAGLAVALAGGFGIGLGVVFRSGPIAAAQAPPPDPVSADAADRVAKLKARLAELEAKIGPQLAAVRKTQEELRPLEQEITKVRRELAAAHDRWPLLSVRLVPERGGTLFEVTESPRAGEVSFAADLRSVAYLNTYLRRARGLPDGPRAVAVSVAKDTIDLTAIRETVEAIKQAGYDRLRFDVALGWDTDTGAVHVGVGLPRRLGDDPFRSPDSVLASIQRVLREQQAIRKKKGAGVAMP